jgi:hypothetical protein
MNAQAARPAGTAVSALNRPECSALGEVSLVIILELEHT